MKQSHGSALLAKKVVAEKLENVIRDSIVASIPACHAGDRGLIPRRGGEHFFFCVAAAADKTGDVEEEEEDKDEEEEVEDKIALAVHADAGMAVHKDGTEHDDRDAGGDGRRAEWKGEDMGGGGSNGSDDGGQGPTNRSRAGEGPASGATWLGVHLSLICSGMGSITSKAAQVKLHYHEEFLRTF
jgi:hypothetical protein